MSNTTKIDLTDLPEVELDETEPRPGGAAGHANPGSS
jgi:hypothetical protein